MIRFGKNRSLGALAASVLLVANGCLYGFAGGGLPSHIRTVAIMPFDNRTAEPSLTLEVAAAVTEAIERRLGLRIASESSADAIVTGIITRYEADIPLQVLSDNLGNVTVTRRRVLISLSVQIFDVQEDRMLWQRSGLTLDGEYNPPREPEGREIALVKLVNDIVDGAQSQW